MAWNTLGGKFKKKKKMEMNSPQTPTSPSNVSFETFLQKPVETVDRWFEKVMSEAKGNPRADWGLSSWTQKWTAEEIEKVGFLPNLIDQDSFVKHFFFRSNCLWISGTISWNYSGYVRSRILCWSL
jgi:hypothetical protein